MKALTRNKLLKIVGLVTSLVVFFYILENVVERGGVLSFDISVLELVKDIRQPFLNKIMLFITDFGRGSFVTSAVFIISLILLVKKKIDKAAFIIFTVAVGQALLEISKILIQRHRPPQLLSLVIEDTFSFPSGHSFVAVTFYGSLIYLLFNFFKNRWQKNLTVLVGFLIIFLIGFSRVYLGAHWLTDVLASFCFGLFWLLLCILTFEYIRKK